jgi:hypothetical protein
MDIGGKPCCLQCAAHAGHALAHPRVLRLGSRFAAQLQSLVRLTSHLTLSRR